MAASNLLGRLKVIWDRYSKQQSSDDLVIVPSPCMFHTALKAMTYASELFLEL